MMDRRLLAVNAANLFRDPVWMSAIEVAIFEGCNYQTVRNRMSRIVAGEELKSLDPLRDAVHRVGTAFRIRRDIYGKQFGSEFERMLEQRRQFFATEQVKALRGILAEKEAGTVKQ